VWFADPKIKAAVEASLGKKDPNPSDMLGLTWLEDILWTPISSLVGLQFAMNLEWLDCNGAASPTCRLWRV